MVRSLDLDAQMMVLEPSFGDGSFLLALIDRLMRAGSGDERQRFERIMTRQLFGIEIDPELMERALAAIADRWGPIPENHNLINGDFFRNEFPLVEFDLVVGNPPYGGTFDPHIEDRLDRKYGKWAGYKLKKETYSFFIARSLDLLAEGGTLRFISSDTFTTIKTMGGLRRRLMDQATVSIDHLRRFSDETVQPTLILTAVKSPPSDRVLVDGAPLSKVEIESTGNFSWRLDTSLAQYFSGPTVGQFMIATGGMTIGRNEYFVRELRDGKFWEPYEFSYFDDPVTLEKEIGKARLGKLSPAVQAKISARERAGETVRNLRVTLRDKPIELAFPHEDYRPYNKADSQVIYAPPRSVVFWKDGGDAVLTFKKNGNWYLHGVGGQKFFEREGLTWQLVSPRIRMRYLPPGYIIDTGAPCAFLRPGVDKDELWFVLGWCQTEEATRILKTVINHTRNIQGKDLERLPYPWWVDASAKREVIGLVRSMVEEGKRGRRYKPADPEIAKLNTLFAFSTL